MRRGACRRPFDHFFILRDDFVASGILPVMPRSCSKASRLFSPRPVEQQDLGVRPPKSAQNLEFAREQFLATSCFVTFS